MIVDRHLQGGRHYSGGCHPMDVVGHALLSCYAPAWAAGAGFMVRGHSSITSQIAS